MDSASPYLKKLKKSDAFQNKLPGMILGVTRYDPRKTARTAAYFP
jgi:hypothetical protein